MLNRRLQEKKKAAKSAAVLHVSISGSNAGLDSYIEDESEKWLRSVIESNSTKAGLYSALWEHGRIRRDGTVIERALHKLVYMRFSQKVKSLLGLAQ